MSGWYILPYQYSDWPRDIARQESGEHRFFIMNRKFGEALNSIKVVYNKSSSQHPFRLKLLIGTSPFFPMKLVQSIFSLKNEIGNDISISSKKKQLTPIFYISIHFHSLMAFELFTALIQTIKADENLTLFSDELIEEFEMINKSIIRDNNSNPNAQSEFTHYLPIVKQTQTSAVSKLLDILKDVAQRVEDEEGIWEDFMPWGTWYGPELDLIKKLLKTSSNVNQQDAQITPLNYAVRYFKNELRLISMLLYYGADPTYHDMDTSDCLSAYEYALYLNKPDLINLLQSRLTTLERPLKSTIQNITTSSTSTEIKTTIEFKDISIPDHPVKKSITSTLKKSIDSYEYKAIIEMSKPNFSVENVESSTNIEDVILADLTCPNRIIEVIRDQNSKVIGYSIFELLTSDDQKRMYWYASLSYILPEHRQSGIMMFLGWRHPLTLQLLNPDKVLAIFFLAVHQNSYRLVQNKHYHFPHWPMYQPPHMESEIRGLLRKINIGSQAKFHLGADDLSCYVTKQINVVDKQVQKPDLYTKFFYENVLDQGASLNSSGKAAPVLIYITDTTYATFAKFCGRIFGPTSTSNLQTHLVDLAPALKKFLPLSRKNELNKELSCHYLNEHFSLFWLNKLSSENFKKVFNTKFRAKL